MDQQQTGSTAARNEAADRYRQVAAVFADRVRGVTDWDAPTPVKEWCARDIVGHLTGWLPGMLAGGSDVTFDPVPSAEEDPVAAWEAFDHQVQDLLDAPASAARLHRNPHTGTAPVPQVIDQYFTSDVAFHTWDLARSSGQDDALDPAFVHAALRGMRAQEEMIRGSGQFGEQHPVPEDATEQEELFAFLGRDPRWRP